MTGSSAFRRQSGERAQAKPREIAVDGIQAALALAREQRFTEARTLLDRLSSETPCRADVWVLLSQLDLCLGSLDAAAVAARRALDLDPARSEALYVLGRVHKSQGELEAARSCYERAIAAQPNDPDALTSLGLVQRELGQLDRAIATYEQALRIRPGHIEATHNLANALKARGVPTDSVEIDRRRGLSLAQQLERLRLTALSALRDNRIADSLAAFDHVLDISPGAAAAMLHSGEFALEMSSRPLGSVRLRYAEEIFRRDPSLYQAADLARRIALGAGLYERAMHFSARAHALIPLNVTLLEQRLAIPAIADSVDGIRRIRQHYAETLDDLLNRPLNVVDANSLSTMTAFYLAYHGEIDRELQIKSARVMLSSISTLTFTAAHCRTGLRPPGRRRVGFISRFFSWHSIARTTRGIMDRLGREEFEVFMIRIMPAAEDDMTRTMRASADHTVTLDPSFYRAREQIAALNLDMLFYQDIGMEPISYLLSFSRLAFVQCVSFGHPNTTGVPNIDYFISNDRFETPEAPEHYSERLFLLRDLPTLAYYYRPELPIMQRERTSLGLPPDAKLYFCPQTVFKIHPDFDFLLEGILERDPKGVVLLIEGEFEEWNEQLHQRFKRTMPALAQRILFTPRLDPARFLKLLAIVDVVLDTVHFNGMNSSLEAFAVGTPVVTLPTRLQRGRHTQAMYQAMGITECIARSPSDYVAIAVRLVNDGQFAHDIRARIADRNHLLFEQQRVVDEFERFFRTALQESS